MAESVDAPDLGSGWVAPIAGSNPALRTNILAHLKTKIMHTVDVHNLKIPLRENEALRLLGKVRPDASMPRPGAQRTTAKPKTKATKRTK